MIREEALTFTCTSCGSANMQTAEVRSAFWEDERLVVVEAIPALVCSCCGEQYFDDATAMGLDLLRGSGFPMDRARYSIEVPVFDYRASWRASDPS